MSGRTVFVSVAMAARSDRWREWLFGRLEDESVMVPTAVQVSLERLLFRDRGADGADGDGDDDAGCAAVVSGAGFDNHVSSVRWFELDISNNERRKISGI